MAATKFRLFQDALRLLGDARLSVITDDVESRYALDDAWDEAVTFVLRQASWRFALSLDQRSSSASSVTGFQYSYTYPNSWLRTQSIFVASSDGREHPIDIREENDLILGHESSVSIRYVSGAYADPAAHAWPENFAQAVAAYLAFLVAERVTGEKGSSGRMSQLFGQLLEQAAQIDAIPDSKWLPHQRSGAMLRGARDLLGQGFWRFALTTAASVSGGTAAPGYAHAFVIPSDHLQTHALFIASAGTEAPFDMRETGATWSANVAAFTVRYVSTVRGLDSRLWPEPFMAALLARLEGGPPRDEQGQRQGPSTYQAALATALAAESEPPNQWLQYQRDGSMLRAARDLLAIANWRFALASMQMTNPIAPRDAAFLHSFPQPATWLKTYQLLLSHDATETPFDIREYGGYWHTDAITFQARYVSLERGLDSSLWPEPFMSALLAGLKGGAAPAAPAAQDAQGGQLPEWQQQIALAIAACAEPASPWLRYQIDGSFDAARYLVLQQGYWVYRGPDGVLHGLKERQYSYLDDQLPSQPSYPFPYRYPLPDDWFRTHALYVPWDGQECPINVAQTSQEWSTDAESFVARYVGTDVLDSATWPEEISAAVLAYLDWQAAPAAEVGAKESSYQRQLAVALNRHSRQPDEWLPYQLDRSFEAGKRELLEKGRWRFATKTLTLTETTDPLPAEESAGEPSDSYAYRFIWPNDLLRVLHVYWLRGDAAIADRIAIDYRDEQGAIHANYTPVAVRYVSRLGLDSTKWSALFRDALLAWLQYREARGDPAKAAIAAEKMAAYMAAIDDAERIDDSRDMPAIRGSRIIAARRGLGSSPRAREMGWW